MDDKKIIYSMIRVSKNYDQKTVIKNLNLSYYYGAKIGVIGLNGSGKSSLLKIMAGRDADFMGETVRAPGFSIGYLEQEPALDPGCTVREIVEQAVAHVVALLTEFDAINERFAEPMSDKDMEKLLQRQGEVQEQLDLNGAWDLDARLELAMDALRCPPGDTNVDVLSGGERRRVALCRLLLQKPDILLLDEPTNHLDAETVAWLERHLQEYEGTVIAVTHDRYFLDNVAGWILEMDRGEGIPWQGNYSSWLEQKSRRLEIEEKHQSDRRKTLDRELEWIRMSPKGRQAKSKARVSSYEALLNQDVATVDGDLQLYIPPGRRLGNRVIEAQDLQMAFGDRVIFENLSFTVPPGAIVGIVGPNGAGKTTLFRMITGDLKPTSGVLALGETVEPAYVDQARSSLDPQKTVWELISGGSDVVLLGKREINSRAYVARFNFSGADQRKLVTQLSGGERNRVHLALTLKSGANLLLLDEPTNDLDVNTMRALEEAIERFAGSAMVISHDRWFLDRIATHVLAFEGDCSANWFQGNYSEYAEYRRDVLGIETDHPQRAKYRSLTRT